jgi:DNA-binding transcriptional ArsR family regulator
VPSVEKAEAADQRVALALRHPMRVELMRLFTETTYSPNELASKLGLSLNSVSYHVRVLHANGFIEPAGERQVRGAVEHFYRGVSRAEISEEEWRSFSTEERSEISSLIINYLFAEALGALQTGALDSRDDRHLTWRPLSLDEQGWGELMDLLLRTMREAETVQARSDERRSRSGEEAITAIFGLMGFERAEQRTA